MNLLSAIKLAKQATSKDMPNIKIESQDGIVNVTGFNRAFSITSCAECDSDLDCTVDATKIYSAVQKFGDAIEQKDGQLKLKQGRSRATIPVTQTEFPQPARQSDDAVVVSGDIVNMIDRVAFAAAKDDVRAVMNGVYIEIKDRKAYVVATHGHRIAWMESDIDIDSESSFIINQSAIGPLVAVAPETIEFGYVARAESPEASMEIIPIDGRYVNWRDVIPASPYIITTSIPTMIDAIQKISVVSNDKMQKGVISFGNGEIVLNSNLKDGSDAVAGFDANVPEQMDIGINVKYLSEVVQAMKGDDLTIGYTNPKKAIYFSDGELNVIVMPVVM